MLNIRIVLGNVEIHKIHRDTLNYTEIHLITQIHT